MKIDYDTLAQEYAKHRQVQPEVVKQLVLRGDVGETSKVLEVGCGTGNYTAALERALGCACWGVDPSERMLERARDKGCQATFSVGRAETLDFPADSFDVVFSVDVIHHVVDRAAFFREALRVLKPGGQLCTVTDSEEIIRHRQPLAVYFPETIEPELLRYPSIAKVRDEMVAAGFHDPDESEVEFAYLRDDIQVFKDKAYSCLHLISQEAFERGIRQMEKDLRRGLIKAVSRYVLVWGRK